jgi:hypothetical protein
MSNSKGVPYFFNNETKESNWEAPTDLTPELIKQLPGAKLLDPKSSNTAVPGKVRASHLLVKHSGSRRPSSWKEVRVLESSQDHVLLNIASPTSHVRKRKLLKFYVSTKLTSRAIPTHPKNLNSWLLNILIVHPTKLVVIWGGLGLVRCRSPLRKERTLSRLVRSVMSSPQTVEST